MAHMARTIKPIFVSEILRNNVLAVHRRAAIVTDVRRSIKEESYMLVHS